MSDSTLAVQLDDYYATFLLHEAECVSLRQVLNSPGKRDSFLRHKLYSSLRKCIDCTDPQDIADVSLALSKIEDGVSQLLKTLAKIKDAKVQKALTDADVDKANWEVIPFDFVDLDRIISVR